MSLLADDVPAARNSLTSLAPCYDAAELDRLDIPSMAPYVQQSKREAFLSWWEKQVNEMRLEGNAYKFLLQNPNIILESPA